MNFAESESYLYSLGNEVETMKLGLDKIRRLLAALGDPQNSYLKVQVAGTNGKGSVCAFLDSICREAKIKTGCFTSPHLISITERIRVNGEQISEEHFAKLATRVRNTSEKLIADGTLENTPTFFEQVTAIALVAFAEEKVDLAILETGMGGRLDATTAANAEIAAITRIDLDHQQYLGNTIEEIAAEKAAIIRADTEAVIIGNQSRKALAVIEDRISQVKGAGAIRREGTPVVVDASCAKSLPLVFPHSRLGLLGRHQTENATVAVAVADKLRSRFTISDNDILAGLENARHPGRLEYLGRYLLDGAHNVGGAAALRDFLDEFETRPITLIFGAMKEKDVGEIIQNLLPRAEYLILTEPESERASSAAKLEEFVPESYDRERLFRTQTVVDALAKAEEVTGEDGVILVTGSLYLVGEVKARISSRPKN